MKKLNVLFLLACMVFVAVGCQKKVNVAFTTSSVHVAAGGGDVEASLTSNGDWEVDSRPEWLTVSPSYGSGDTPLTLTVSANPDQVERVGEVKVSAKDNTATLTVTQAAATQPVEDFISITPNLYQCGEEGGEFEVEVSSNFAWMVSGVPDWMTCTPLEGTGEAVVTLTVSAIASEISDGRESDLVFGNESIHTALHVMQSREPQVNISVMPKVIDMGYEGGTSPVAVVCDGAWTASASEDWVTLNAAQGEGNAELMVTVSENPTFESRQASVVLVSSTGMEAVVSVRQGAAPTPNPSYLEVTPNLFSFSKEGGSQELSISCDSEWKIDLSSDWLSVSEVLGNGNGTVVLTATANAIVEPRSIEFEVVSESLSRRVFVTQEAGDEILFVTLAPDTLSVSHNGTANAIVNVTSNTTWTLQASPWITNLPSSVQQGDAMLYLIVDLNSSEEPRYGFVRALHNGQVMSEIVIAQDGKPDLLETDVTAIEVGPEGGVFVIHVASNQSWSALTDVMWMNCNPTTGFGNGDIELRVDAMMGTRPRIGYIQLKAASGKLVTITVNQHQ